MSKLEELINQLCPDGVEQVVLGDVCGFKNGFAFKSSLLRTFGKPILRITNIGNGKIHPTDFVYFDANDYKEDLTSYVVEKGDIVVAMSGATTGKIGVNTSEEKYYLNQRVGKFLPNEALLRKKFLYHWLLSQSKNILKVSSGVGAQPNLSSEKMKTFQIPLPPLPVQEEIVRILDNMTSFTEELKEKLAEEKEARQKQYEYYRDSLLSFDDGNAHEVRWMKLEDVGTFTRGKRFVKADAVSEGTPCIHYGEIYTHYGHIATEAKSFLDKDLASKLRFASKGDVIIVGAGENDWDIGVGVAWMSDEDVAVHDACYIFKHGQNPRYISHYLRTTYYHEQIKKYVSRGKICAIHFSGIGKALIPIPSLEEQERIANILDCFDKFCNDITEGLPAEIEARKKQYEYYRDKLLTFKEKEA